MSETIAPQRRETTDERRIAIALAARALLIEKGFEGLRTRDIAERVGINIATLHYHVPSKEALCELVAESMRDDFRAHGQKFPREGMTSLGLLRRELADYRDILETAPDLLKVFSELMMRAKRDENIRRVIEPMHTFWVSRFESILAAGVTDGTFRPGMDPPAAAHMITAALKIVWSPPDSHSAFDRLAAEIERSVINPQNSKQDARQ